MSNWEEASCETNGIMIHYARTGGKKPPLILLHGLTGNGACWADLAHSLEKEYDVIMPDARGHGNSSVPDFGYQYEDLANDAVGLISALSLHAPILLGHAMGGMTAAVVASRKPNLLSGLVLADPMFLDPKAQREARDSDASDQHRKMLKMPVDEAIAEARNRHPNQPEGTIRVFAKARLQTSMAAFDVLTPPSPDYRMLIKSIDIPSLIVFGDSGVVSPDIAEELQRLNPRLQTVQICDAGHNVHLDQPERFQAVASTFIYSINTSV